jgi:putative ABC transport system permease protein
VNAIRRGVRNAFRNVTRTVAVVLIVSAILALAIAMFVSRQATGESVQTVSQNLGTSVLVSPVGGFFGSGNPLTSAQVSEIANTKDVVSVAASVTDRLTGAGGSTSTFNQGSGGTTSLTSALTIGQLGARFGRGGGGGRFGYTPPNPNTPASITIIGTSSPLEAKLLSADSVTLTSGAAINGSSSALDADVGSGLAAKNDLKAGSTFTAYGKTFTVAGIFTTSSTTANADLVVPLATEEQLLGVDGVDQVIATVNTLGNVQSAANAIQSELGSSVADVTTSQTGSSRSASQLGDIKTISTFSLVGAIVAAIAILLMSMLMIVRERRREIGILKAFGSSNGGIVSSFVAEALCLTVLSAVVGVVVGVAISSPILNALVSGTKPSSGGGGFRGFRGGGFIPGSGFGGATLSNLHAVFGTGLIVYCIAIVLGIALLGSAIPAYAIAKIRPAEVLRSDT